MNASAHACGCDYGVRPIPHICQQHRTPSGAGRRWIGVDLDGVLAVECATPAEVWQVGAPIPAMVEQVKTWLQDGEDVRIFTARVGACGQISSIAWDNPDFAAYQREIIDAWCLAIFGRTLPITATKDFQMIRYYDDRGVQMITNTGRRLAEYPADDELNAIVEAQIDWLTEKRAISRDTGKLALVSILMGIRDAIDRSGGC